MSGFLFAFVTVCLFSCGGREPLLIARLSATMRGPVLPMWAMAIGCVSAGIMAWGGNQIAQLLPSAGKTMLVAFALLLAAAALAWPDRTGPPKEPTRSLGAIGIVVFWWQMIGASRFAIFAFAAWSANPWPAGAGGALGGAAAIITAWAAGQDLIERWPLRAIRAVLAIAAVSTAAIVALFARGLAG
ncbi:MAG: hypothetical protein WA948_08625 [Pontixanthobacter sp.]